MNAIEKCLLKIRGLIIFESTVVLHRFFQAFKSKFLFSKQNQKKKIDSTVIHVFSVVVVFFRFSESTYNDVPRQCFSFLFNITLRFSENFGQFLNFNLIKKHTYFLRARQIRVILISFLVFIACM